MPWSTSPDVFAFQSAAGDFLASRPVEHSPLLTETAYLLAHPATDALFGWWTSLDGDVRGAFVQAPRHAPILSLMPAGAVSELPATLPRPAGLGVDSSLVDAVVAAWRSAGVELAPRHMLTVLRLGDALLGETAPGAPSAYDLSGTHRIAGPADRPLLVRWFEELMAAHPGDPSDLAYVVDDPLTYGGIVLWTVDGEPVAMAGRSRTVAGMARLSAVHQPTPGREYADAAFAAACAQARLVARDVLVFSGDPEESDRLRSLGFEDAAQRVMLTPLS